MKIAVFSAKRYDREFLEAANAGTHLLRFLEPHLNDETVSLAAGFDAVCVFVNDTLSAPVLETLAAFGVKLIALRCAGFNNVDLATAARLGQTVVRVPAYSPHAVAEHAVALILGLNRKIHRAYNRVREGNFSLDGLLGFDLYGRTVGVIGMGRIGTIFAQLMIGFGCQVLCYDPTPDPARLPATAKLVSLEEIYAQSDIISLHCPLTPQNNHLIDSNTLQKMKDGVMLINTSRGALLDTKAVIESLKSGKVGALGMDVYEEEGDLFFEDLSNRIIPDDVFTRLLTFPNVLITGHQAFFTREALQNIAQTTVQNINEWEKSGTCKNGLLPPLQ
jgi:D-lactate dehydrogenase